MIGAVGAWVKEIVFIVLFAAFLELLLPGGSMRKFVRVIMGLLIMMAVLNPVIGLLEKEPGDGETVVFSSVRGGDYPAANMAKSADAVREKRQQLAKEYYAKELARQIRATAMSVGGVTDAQVTVSLREDTGREPENSRTPVPAVARVVILAAGESTEPAVIMPVQISVGTPPDSQTAAAKEPVTPKTALNPLVKEKISRVISELYHLNPENIEVWLLQ